MLEGESTRPQTESVQDDARWSEAEGREAAVLSFCLLEWFNEVV